MKQGRGVRTDRDGVRIVEVRPPGTRWRRILLPVLAIAVVVSGLHWRSGGGKGDPGGVSGDETRAPAGPGSTVTRGAAREAAAEGAAPIEAVTARPPLGSRKARRREKAAVGPERELTLTDVKPLLHGKREGIGVFPLPGSDPPKSGLIVPEDFPLPEGYVRHYQTTDDGKALPPILMFHPDYEWVDDAGNPVPIPPDRVVPPELAPPGMPLRKLELPDAPPHPEDRR